MIAPHIVINPRAASSRTMPHVILAPLLISLMLPLALLTPGAIWAQSYTCVLYSDILSATYMRFPNSNYIIGEFDIYLENTCASAVASIESAPLGFVRAQTQAAARQLCSEIHETDLLAFRDFTKYNSQEIWYCLDPTAIQSFDAQSAGSSRLGNSAEDRESLRDRLFSCERLAQETDLEITAVNGLRSGIECQRVDEGGIGIRSVIDLGVQDAVDVWSYVGGGYEVCFPQRGRIIFLDAATAPRAVYADIAYDTRDGYTCASRRTAGTLVLVRDDSADVTPDSSASGGAKVPAAPKGEAITWAHDLQDCQVTTAVNLRLRRRPGGDSLRLLPRNTILTATRRTVYWFKIQFDDVDGWISARYTKTAGNCAADDSGNYRTAAGPSGERNH